MTTSPPGRRSTASVTRAWVSPVNQAAPCASRRTPRRRSRSQARPHRRTGAAAHAPHTSYGSARYCPGHHPGIRLGPQGEADLSGEHPVIVEAESPEAADHIRRHASRLGISSSSGTHADGTWIEFLDPDGIALRVVHSPTPTESFLGVTFGPDGRQRFYHQPRLDVPIRPSPADGHRPSRRTPQPQ